MRILDEGEDAEVPQHHLAKPATGSIVEPLVIEDDPYARPGAHRSRHKLNVVAAEIRLPLEAFRTRPVP